MSGDGGPVRLLDDPDVLAVLDRYRTCELATVNRSGVPIAWPTSPLYRPEDGTFVITTSIGLPQKAYNVRRNPRVALHFSDPTASGLDGMPQVLVQGEARCPEAVVTSPAGLEEYWVRLLERQPAGRSYSGSAVTRSLMAWYYRRVVITVTPTRVHTRPPLPLRGDGRDPVVGRAERPPRGSLLADVERRLAPFPTGVLTALDAGGTPWLLRVRTRPDASGVLRVDVPPGEALQPGPASVLCHSHDEHLWSLRTAVVVGELHQDEEGWALRPTRVLRGADGSPLGALETLRDCRRAERRYLLRAGITAPPVPWDEYAPLKAEAVRRSHRPGR